jgi:ribose-phosphate pyrophosphokinase
MSKGIKVFSCNANKKLAEMIAARLNLSLGLSEVKRFSDGEINMRINETVRDNDVFIIQSTSPPVNENLMELLIMIDAIRRASAGSINAVIPYFGYARQDRKLRARDPISAKLVADIITSAGANRILTMDLHCAQIQGFFNIPVDHLVGQTLFVNYFKERLNNDELKNTIVVSPDFGSVARARNFASKLNVPLAIVDKRREEANVSEVLNIIGNVKDRLVILVDDIIDTAGTLVNAAYALKEHGAKKIFACCTHALLSGDAKTKINSSEISELIILDTISFENKDSIDKIKFLSVASIFAKAILHVHEGLSVSQLFS